MTKLPGQYKATFNVPNFTDNKVPLGVGGSANVGRYNAGEVPNITGTLSGLNNTLAANLSGAFSSSSVMGNSHITSSVNNYVKTSFDASRSSSVYKNVSRVIAHGVMMFYCVKY